MHQGTITVESGVGKGTTFFIRFPKFDSKKSKSVLIVDDEQSVRALHTQYIKRAMPDTELLYAMDGYEALGMAKKYHPAVIISDYGMPTMDGLEFIQEL